MRLATFWSFLCRALCCSALSHGINLLCAVFRLHAACGDLAFTIGTVVQVLFQFYGYFWAMLLGCFLRQCCCLKDDVDVPKWALLMARFYQRAIFPPQSCLLVFVLFTSTPVTLSVLRILHHTACTRAAVTEIAEIVNAQDC